MTHTNETPDAVAPVRVDPLTPAELFILLGDAVKRAGSQAAFAAEAKVTPQHVNDVLSARRGPSDDLLAFLRLRKVTRFVPIR